MTDIDDKLAAIGRITYQQAIEAGLSEDVANNLAQEAIWEYLNSTFNDITQDEKNA